MTSPCVLSPCVKGMKVDMAGSWKLYVEYDNADLRFFMSGRGALMQGISLRRFAVYLSVSAGFKLHHKV